MNELAKAMAAVDEATKDETWKTNPVPRMGPRPTVNVVEVEANLIDVPDETLAVLMNRLVELQQLHQKEIAAHTARIVAKINSINSAIK